MPTNVYDSRTKKNIRHTISEIELHLCKGPTESFAKRISSERNHGGLLSLLIMIYKFQIFFNNSCLVCKTFPEVQSGTPYSKINYAKQLEMKRAQLIY